MQEHRITSLVRIYWYFIVGVTVAYILGTFQETQINSLMIVGVIMSLTFYLIFEKIGGYLYCCIHPE